jgi:chromosome segregation ATPase
MMRLRTRVHELESELTICRDELGRARNLLEQDKDNSARYVRELDVVHRKHQDQVLELRGMLNQSEQARRELEIQNQSLESKAQLVQESFHRAKEQTEAREQYFADLKRKFEDVQHHFEKELAAERDAKAELQRQLQSAETAMSRQKSEMDQFKEQERTRREKEEGVRKLLHESESKLVAAREMEEKVSAASKQLHLLFGQWQKDFFINKSKEEAELEQYFLA